ncbi:MULTISPECIES: DUF6274 family protein [Streptomyces]|uniref:Zf-HC2 domain-containing protein n=1 Tax=Streptomyces luteosporeus TaxID=173856 RepID=A0ABN3U3S6_9ACTN
MTTTTRTERARHETRALLRAHLSAAAGYRHLTRHCPVCHRLLQLAQEGVGEPAGPPGAGVTLSGEGSNSFTAAP